MTAPHNFRRVSRVSLQPWRMAYWPPGLCQTCPSTAYIPPSPTHKPGQFSCHPNATRYACPWHRTSVWEPTAKKAFERRKCPGNAIDPNLDLYGMLLRLQYHREESGIAADGEGGAPLGVLESWVSTPNAPKKPRRICEVGLNRGESAMAWLCTFPTAHYLGFDLLQYNASVHALKFLKLAFPGRVKIIGGASAETVKAHALAKPGTCDVVSVDGGHQFVNAWSDLSYMRLLARDGPHTVVMDDVRCTTWWCKPPTVTWHHFRESGVVRERGCVIAGCCTGWCWGEFNRSAPQPNAEAVCKGSKEGSRHHKSCLSKTKGFVWPKEEAAMAFRRSTGRNAFSTEFGM